MFLFFVFDKLVENLIGFQVMGNPSIIFWMREVFFYLLSGERRKFILPRFWFALKIALKNLVVTLKKIIITLYAKFFKIFRYEKIGQARLDGAFCDYTEADKMAYLNEIHKKGVRNIEMEGTLIASMCNRANIRSCMVCVVLLNRLLGDQVSLSKETKAEYEQRPWWVVLRYIQKHMWTVKTLFVVVLKHVQRYLPTE